MKGKGKSCGKMMSGGKTEAKPSAGKVKGAFKKGGAVKMGGHSSGGALRMGGYSSGGSVGKQNKSGW